MRQAAIEESRSSEWNFDYPEEEDERELPVEEMIMSPIYEKECRDLYEKSV
jgi:hypothetical protein